MDEIIIKDENEKQSFADIIIKNREFIYPALFYLAGLILGSFFFTYINKTNLAEIIESVFKLSTDDFYTFFLNKFCVYFSLFTITVLLGLCLVGFPFINIIPLFSGMEIALKISYYYVNFSVKGIGYALLMIIPESACFITVLIYTIKTSSALSRYIYSVTTKKSDMNKDINLKSYLKNFLIYAIIVVAISVINALATYLLSSIITI